MWENENGRVLYGSLLALIKGVSAGATVASVPSSGTLAGSPLRGRLFLEVPVQNLPVPQAILDHAAELNVVIRDISGSIYQ